MGVLSKTELEKLLNERLLIIESTIPQLPFDPKKQVTAEAIDLRLGYSGLRYKDSITQIDTLFEKDLDNCFEKVEIPASGYTLQPGQVLFASTLELVCLATKEYVGRIFGRSTFARFGFSVHCTQPKLSAGVSHAFPLQIVNHNSFPIVIYPSCYIAQLMIETTSGPAVPYNGKYEADITLHPPKINPRELESIPNPEALKAVKIALSENSQKVMKIVDDFEKREREAVLKPKLSSKKINIAKSIVFAAVSAFCFGFFGNLLATPEANYWKSVASFFSFLLGLVFLGLSISCSFSDQI